MKTIVPGVLSVRVFTGFEPFAFYQEGELVGFDIDVIRGFADETGLSLAFSPADRFDNIWLDPGGDTCDLATAGIARFTEREHPSIAWSVPYFEVKRSVLIHHSRAAELRDIRDFAGRAIAFVAGSSADLDTRQRAPDGTKLVPIERQSQGMDLLRSGQVDGLAMGAPSNAHNQRLNPEFVLIDQHDFAQPEGLRFPVSARNPEFLRALNEYLEKVRKTGTLEKFARHWMSDEI